jgi:lysine-N-methylase
MSLPVRALPVVQNWDCGGCTSCCREYIVHVTDAEKERIEKQGWENEPGFAGVTAIVREKGRWRLSHGADKACVFLGEGGRCRIHEKFGSAAKPLACRIYPFMLVPAGNEWRVGLRFACPAAAASEGRPLNQHLSEVREYAAALEKQTPGAVSALQPPRLQGRQKVSWEDLGAFVRALGAVVSQRHDRVERRLRKCLALAEVCKQAKFDKVTGRRLDEFLEILIAGLDGEAPADPATVPEPTWVGRIFFRQLLALLARKDSGPNIGIAQKGRIALLGAAYRFARGSGRVPRVHGLLPETTFEKLEEPAGPLPADCELILERYYLTKIHSMQFAGKTNFDLRFWEGLESLVLTYPAIIWLSRAFADRPQRDALLLALRIVDDSFGFHPLLGSARQKLVLRILSFRGEIAKLVAWYSR